MSRHLRHKTARGALASATEWLAVKYDATDESKPATITVVKSISWTFAGPINEARVNFESLLRLLSFFAEWV